MLTGPRLPDPAQQVDKRQLRSRDKAATRRLCQHRRPPLRSLRQTEDTLEANGQFRATRRADARRRARIQLHQPSRSAPGRSTGASSGLIDLSKGKTMLADTLNTASWNRRSVLYQREASRPSHVLHFAMRHLAGNEEGAQFLSMRRTRSTLQVGALGGKHAYPGTCSIAYALCLVAVDTNP